MRGLGISAFAVLLVSWMSAQSSSQAPRPARDTPAQSTAALPAGTIAGRVFSADDGRPVKRARAFVVAAELPDGRGTLTDDGGAFQLTGLPPGRYTLTVSKAGYVTLSYGQRRPLQGGTPLQLGDGQQMTGLDFRLPRGSAIAGRVFDDVGDPAAGATVRVMRFQYSQGTKQLSQAGTAQTDDRGAFRVWGLNPGAYYVTATQRHDNALPGGPADPSGSRGEGRRGRGAIDQTPGEIAQQAYAPTYYPGVGAIGEAALVTVGVGQESSDINFNLILVHTARVSGFVSSASGAPATNGLVSLTPDGGGRALSPSGTDFSGRIEFDGRFVIVNVPPGRYILRARANQPDAALFAAQPLSIAEGDASSVGVLLYPGATISGTVSFDGPAPPDFRQVRVTAPSVESSVLGPDPSARIDKDGRFVLDGVPAGTHWIRTAGMRGWSLKSVTVDGRDLVDAPIELASAQRLSNVSVVLTSRQTQINGTILNDRSVPVTDVTVLAFPTDTAFWQPFARQILAVRPDQNGAFRLRGLPPGEYYLVTVDPDEQGEWYEPAFLEQHRATAVRLALGEGDVKTSDLRVSSH